jgi:hypothetical protein
MTQSIPNQPENQHFRRQPPANPTSVAAPRGLVRCPVCHEYRGAVRNEDLPAASQRENAVVAVLCICDGIPCRKCGKNPIHRPISNFWDEARGALVHCPWFSAQVPCKPCLEEQKPLID